MRTTTARRSPAPDHPTRVSRAAGRFPSVRLRWRTGGGRARTCELSAPVRLGWMVSASGTLIPGRWRSPDRFHLGTRVMNDHPTKPGPVHHYLALDHDRLGILLDRALAGPGDIDLDSYKAFRAGLLRHIGLEERLLFPSARRLGDRATQEMINRLHREHALFAAMLVPQPTAEILSQLRDLLGDHNKREEQPSGLYEVAERIAGPGCGDVGGGAERRSRSASGATLRYRVVAPEYSRSAPGSRRILSDRCAAQVALATCHSGHSPTDS